MLPLQGHLLAHIVRAALLIGSLWSAFNGNAGIGALLIVSLIASLIVFEITRRAFGITGAWLDLLFALLVAFDNLFGLALGFYATVPYWDVATHYTTSIFLAVSALVLAERAYPPLITQAPKPTIVAALVLFALGLGALWELGEYASDILRATTFQKSLDNTMQDLFVDLIAGLIVGVAWANRKT